MKFLVFTHVYPPAIDGGSRGIAKLGQYLQTQGHSLLVLTSNCSSTDSFVSPQIPILPLPFVTQTNPGKSALGYIYRLPVYRRLRRPLKLLYLIFSRIPFFSSHPYFLDLLSIYQKGPIFKIIPFLRAFVACLRFHPNYLIVGPLPLTTILYARFISYFTRVPLIIDASFHPHDPDFTRQPLLNTLAQANYIWSKTDYETHLYHHQLKLSSPQILTLGSGVDPSHLIQPNRVKFPEIPTILFIGVLAAHKRVDLLVDVFPDLIKIHPDLRLVIAGQTTLYYPVIAAKIHSLPQKIQSQIQLRLNFKQTSLPRLIDQATFLVQPSLHEAFGLVLIESLARAKPILVSDIPSMAEIAQKTGGGFTFKTNSPTNLIYQANYLLNHPQVCRQAGQKGHHYVRSHYTWDKIGECLLQNLSP